MSVAAAPNRWLVVGHLGMLGSDLMAALADRDVTGVDRPEIDITNSASVSEIVSGFNIVVNCAAFTAVDDAETDERTAFAVNAVGPANLARTCARTGARLLHISTDYVFAGDSKQPYPTDADVAPRSAYGRTKAAGEWAVRSEIPGQSWILRTAWLYGAHGPNFVRTMLDLESKLETVSVVTDQLGQPTWSADLAERIVGTVEAGAPAGTYHATSTGQTSWFEFARAIFALAGANPDRVLPTTSDHFVRPAPRPAFSVLDHSGWRSAGLPPLRHWEDALRAAWPELRAAWLPAT